MSFELKQVLEKGITLHFSNPHKTIIWAMEANLVFNCPMTYKTFPHDENTCKLTIYDKLWTKKGLNMTTGKAVRFTMSGYNSLPTNDDYDYKVSS